MSYTSINELNELHARYDGPIPRRNSYAVRKQDVRRLIRSTIATIRSWDHENEVTESNRAYLSALWVNYRAYGGRA